MYQDLDCCSTYHNKALVIYQSRWKIVRILSSQVSIVLLLPEALTSMKAMLDSCPDCSSINPRFNLRVIDWVACTTPC